jgi:chaperonin GroES
MQETPKEKDAKAYKGRDIDWLIGNIANQNIAEDLDEKELIAIGSRVKEDYEIDCDSRTGYDKMLDKALDLAKQVSSGRTYAGETVADVKYPIIATAAIQYSSRALSAITKPEEVVKHRVVGLDVDGSKAARGVRVSNHMNYQILEQMDNWDGDMDKLLIQHSITGCHFKKLHYDATERENRADLISPKDLIVNYWAKSLGKAQQITHKLEYTHNEYLEFVASGMWKDIDLDRPEDINDKTHTFLEQHRRYDLDGDGYEEPYIITIEEKTNKVVRIRTGYSETGIIEHAETGEIIKIKPKQYFVMYPFMESFDGSFYPIGFGALLSPINEAVNTLMNQLIDAGTRANRQCGFIGRGVRLLRGGESGTVRFKSGEWKQVQSIGGDLRANIVPLPSGEPSNVLFQLLGLLLEASKELASRSDLLSGNQQQHNVPATTTLALIEQGLQVFGGIYKRVFKALKSELKMLFEMNRDYLEEKDYLAIVDDPAAAIADYTAEGFDIIPVSSQSSITETQKYVKGQAMMEQLGRGYNDNAIREYYLQSIEVPDIKKFMEVPEQGPTFEEQIEMEKLRQADMRLRLDAERLEMEMEMNVHKGAEIRSKVIKNIADAESKEVGQQIQQYQQEADAAIQKVQLINDRIAMLEKVKKEKEAAEQAKAQAAQAQQGNAQQG